VWSSSSPPFSSIWVKALMSAPAEKTIGTDNVSSLTQAWKTGNTGYQSPPPIVADGCVFINTNRGWVFALHADTGEVVWKTEMPRGGSANGTVAVAPRRCDRRTVTKRVKRKVKGNNGKKRTRWVIVRKRKWIKCNTVFVAASRTQSAEGCPEGEVCQGPYVAAFDQATGALVWATEPIDKQPGADVYGSPVIFDGVLMPGTSGGSAELGDEADRYAAIHRASMLSHTNISIS